MSMTRARAIDNLKGIGIIAVMIGHLAFPKEIINLVYFFHMPLFFFASGYCHRDQGVKALLVKQKWLILSYFFYAIVFLLYSSFVNGVSSRWPYLLLDLLSFRPLAISSIPYFLIFWFPISLLAFKLIDSLLYMIPLWVKFSIAFLLYQVCSLPLLNDFIVNLPLCLGQACILSVFYYTGLGVKRYIADKEYHWRVTLGVLALYLILSMSVIGVADGNLYKLVNYHQLLTFNPFIAYFLAIIGIMLVWLFAKKLSNKTLSLFGQYSYFIMSSHLLLFSAIKKILMHLGEYVALLLPLCVLIVSLLVYCIVLRGRCKVLSRTNAVNSVFDKLVFLQ